MNRYDNNLADYGGYTAKTFKRSDGEGFYQTRKSVWTELGTKSHKPVQRYSISPNSDGVYTERRVGLFSQDLHKGNMAGNVPRRTDPMLEHYRKLREYYDKKARG